MKIGLITEGAIDGADQAVCRHLVGMILPDAEVLCRPLGNLPSLKTDCGKVAAALLEEGCSGVLIVWDLYPGWRTDGQAPCRREHREDISGALTEAKADASRVHLVCIEEELEAWLLADHRAVTTFINSKPIKNKNLTASRHRDPEKIDKPKTWLDRFIREHWGRPYVDRVHAIQIIKSLADLRDARRSVTFQRFEAKVKGIKP